MRLSKILFMLVLPSFKNSARFAKYFTSLLSVTLAGTFIFGIFTMAATRDDPLLILYL